MQIRTPSNKIWRKNINAPFSGNFQTQNIVHLFQTAGTKVIKGGLIPDTNSIIQGVVTKKLKTTPDNNKTTNNKCKTKHFTNIALISTNSEKEKPNL